MLEGPAEQAILKAGQWCADQLAYRRVSKKYADLYKDYVKQSNLPREQIRKATRRALKEALLIRRRPHAFSSLRFFALTRNEPLSDFVDAGEYWRIFHRQWGGPSRSTTDAKTLTKKLLGTDALPDIGYFVAGRWFDLDWRITTLNDLVSGLGQSQEVVLKADYSESGNAVEILTVKQLLDPTRNVRVNSVLQRKIDQHAFFTDISGGKGCTIRIMSGFWPTQTKPHLISALIKWDVLGDQATSRVQLDLATGTALSPIYGPGWIRIPLPAQGEQKLVVPGFQAAKDLILDLHSRSPHYQLIGWDLILDADQNPWIFEWNADHPAIHNPQGFNGPVLREGIAGHKSRLQRH